MWNVSKLDARKKVLWEVEHYKANADEKVKIIEEKHLNDGTVLIKVKKKVSGYDIGNYFLD